MAPLDDISRRMADDNAVTRYHLLQQLRSPLGVIPFVGAGMSVRFKFRKWDDILREAAIVEGPQTVADVDRHLQAGEYEEAAELLRQRGGEDNFQRRVEKEFGRSLSPQELRSGPLTLLPFLSSGPVITTNFDHVLESVFREFGQPFTERILGPDPDRILKAIHRDSRVLIKMHGDCEDRRGRSFTQQEYEQHYGLARTGLGSLAWLMFSHRPLLFLGCSLDKDRTVRILERIHQEFGALTHYAIVEAPGTPDAFDARRKKLLDLGISPLWFPTGQFHLIESLLADLLEGMSVQELAPASATPSPPPTKPASALPSQPPAVRLPQLDTHFEHVRRRLFEGRLLFFLGAGAHLGAFALGTPFYERLRRAFRCPEELGHERSAISEYIVDRHGRAQLWAAMREQLLPQPGTEPSLVLSFLAWLPSLLRGLGRGDVASQWLVTTNQDCMLERAFEAAGEPFHLLYAQSHGEHEGRFLHVTPEQRVTVIQRPEHLRRLSDASVIVRLNGGVLHRHVGLLPESTSTTRRDFARLAARIPDALPQVLRQALEERSLLFLGHGLTELAVEELVRHAAGPSRAWKSWAVQHPASRADYWASCGLEVLDADLHHYIPALHARLAQSPPAPRGLP